MDETPDLGEVLQQHGGGLRRLSAALLGAHDAEDAVQEVCLEALQAPAVRTESAGGWLRTVLQHTAWRIKRARQRRSRREDAVAQRRGDVAMDHAEAIAREEMLHRLIAAVHALDPGCRDAVWRRYFEGQPPRVIAASSGVSVATVKSRLHRGLAVLRQRLGERRNVDWRSGLLAAFRPDVLAPQVTWPAWPGWIAMTAAKKTTAVAAAMSLLFGLCAWLAIASTPPEGVPTSTMQPALAAAAVEPTTVVTPDRVAAAPSNPAAAASATAPVAAPPAGARALVRGRLLDAVTRQPLGGLLVVGSIQAPMASNDLKALLAIARDTERRRSGSSSAATDQGESRSAAQPQRITAVAGFDGRFTLDVPALQEVVLQIAAPDRRHWHGSTRPAANTVDDLGDVLLEPACAVALRVVDVESGAAVAGIEVTLSTPDGRSGLPAGISARAGEDGVCTFAEGAPIGVRTVSLGGATHELVEPARIDVAFDGPREFLVQVRRLPRIQGICVDEAGAPLAGIAVSTRGPRDLAAVRSGADGVFTLVRPSAADPAHATLHFVDTQLRESPPARADVPWGTTGLRFVLRRPPPFAVEVVDDAGAPVESFGVSIARDGVHGARVRQTGNHAGGRLLVDGVVRGATWLRVVPTAAHLTPTEMVACSGGEPLRLVVARRVRCRVQVVCSGQPVVDAVVEHVHERGARTPRDPDAPAPDMRSLRDPHAVADLPVGGPERLATARTGADGIAEFWRDASPDGRALLVRSAGTLAKVVRAPVFPSDGAPLRVEVAAASTVRGRVEFAGRIAPSRVHFVEFQSGSRSEDARIAADGSFVSPSLPAGPCRVRLVCERSQLRGVGEAFFVRDLHLAAGETARVDFDFGAVLADAGATVRGRVVADAPRPARLEVALWQVSTSTAASASADQVRMTASVPLAADGTFAIADVAPGRYRTAMRIAGQEAALVPCFQPGEFDVVGADVCLPDLHFVHRRLTVRFVDAHGAPARRHHSSARCAGLVWPSTGGLPTFLLPPLGETLVLDPAPSMPIEFGAGPDGPWSRSVAAPADRREAEVTVVLPGP